MGVVLVNANPDASGVGTAATAAAVIAPLAARSTNKQCQPRAARHAALPMENREAILRAKEAPRKGNNRMGKVEVELASEALAVVRC